MAREYRITFVSFGPDYLRREATNEYKRFRDTPEFLAWNIVTSESEIVGTGQETQSETLVSASKMKANRKLYDCAAEADGMETPLVSIPACTSKVEAHINNHALSHFPTLRKDASSSFMEVDTLRGFTKNYLATAPVGSQSALAKLAGIPKGTLSKFLEGRTLPKSYRGTLQIAVARSWTKLDYRWPGAKPWLSEFPKAQMSMFTRTLGKTLDCD